MSQNNLAVTVGNPIWRFVIAIAIGMVAMFFLYKYEDSVLLERSGGRRVGIMVAKTEIAAGERIEPEKVEVQEIPIAYVHANALRAEDQNSVLHQKVYRKIPQNSFLQWSDLDDHSDDQSRTLGLPRGMRATALPLGPLLSRARSLRKGDVIDVLVHLKVGEQESATITLFQQVLVLEQEEGFALVALSPEQAEQLTFAMAQGAITVVLRNRDDPEQRALPRVVFQDILKGYPGPVPSTASPPPTGASVVSELKKAITPILSRKGKK